MEDKQFIQLLDQFGFSWAGYRRVRKGVKKRLARHMQEMHCVNIENYIEAIKKDHPEVLLVQAEPFCLGSGWILLLWPVLLTGWLLARRRSGKGRRMERHA